MLIKSAGGSPYLLVVGVPLKKNVQITNHRPITPDNRNMIIYNINIDIGVDSTMFKSKKNVVKINVGIIVNIHHPDLLISCNLLTDCAKMGIVVINI